MFFFLNTAYHSTLSYTVKPCMCSLDAELTEVRLGTITYPILNTNHCGWPQMVPGAVFGDIADHPHDFIFLASFACRLLRSHAPSLLPH